MTPFGRKLRSLRRRRGLTLRAMAAELQVSPAYLSALEHGRRSRPRPGLVQQVAAYFGLIWDEVEDLERLARLSHPRVIIDTAGMSDQATLFANVLAARIHTLDEETLARMLTLVDPEGETRDKPPAAIRSGR